jgi:uncharacterized delta-60 repeat protein
MRHFFSRPIRSKVRRTHLGIEKLDERWMMTAGEFDTNFGDGGVAIMPFDLGGSGLGDDVAASVAIQPDGKIVVVGTAQIGRDGDTDFAVTRLNSDGSPDLDFSGDGRVTIPFNLGGLNTDTARAVAIDSQGRIVVAGEVVANNGDSDFGIARLLSNGEMDLAFGFSGKSRAGINVGGAYPDSPTDVAIDAQGRIVVVGSASSAQGTGDFAVVRVMGDGFQAGFFDPSFDGDGRAVVSFGFDIGSQGGDSDGAAGVAIDSQGRIVVAGTVGRADYHSDFGMIRLEDGGALDMSFGNSGKQWVTFDQFAGDTASNDIAQDVAIDAQGRIVVAGGTYASAPYTGAFAVARLTDAGSFDTGFGQGGLQIVNFDLGGSFFDFASSVAIDARGRIVLAGSSSSEPIIMFGLSNKDSAVTCLKEDGFRDNSFGEFFGREWFDANRNSARDEAYDVAIDAGGSIIVVGPTNLPRGNNNINNNFYVAKLQSEDNTPPMSERLDAVRTSEWAPVNQVRATFSKPVQGVTPRHFGLQREGVAIPLGGEPTTFTSDGGLTWTLSNLRSLTTERGTYQIWIDDSVPGITDLLGNPLAGASGGDWVMARLAGDINDNQMLDFDDANHMSMASALADPGSPIFDLNSDDKEVVKDLHIWVKDLAKTWIGDANVDGVFDSSDLVLVFQAGKFEQAVDAVWSEGDWNGDGRFDTADLVAAFQDGGYNQGRRV